MERRIKSSKTDHSSILLQMNETDLTRKSGSNAHASNGIKLRCIQFAEEMWGRLL